MLIFLGMGVLFSLTFDRLRKANQQAASALEAVSVAKDQLDALAGERTAKMEEALDALRESEREFRTLAEAIPQIVWTTRPDGWDTYFNQQWVDYTGMTLEESCGHGWNIPFHPDDKQRAWDAWQQAMASGGTYALEVRLRRADGVYRWWLTRGVPLRDAGGAILKWFGTCTDIEDIKQAEAARQESDARIRNVFEQANDGIYVISAENRYLDANARGLDMLGYTREELRQMSVADVLAPHEVARLTVEPPRMMSGVPHFAEWEHRRKDGSTFPGEVSARRLNDQSYLAIVRDLTERRRAEAALLASKTQLEAALASMTDAVFISDSQGRFIEFNDAFATFHKFRNKEECATTLAEYPAFLDVFLPNGDMLPLEQWAVPRALRGETVSNAIYTLKRKDTGETWVGSYSFAPIRDRDDAIVGSVMVGRDITDQKRKETELERMRRILNEGEKLAHLGSWEYVAQTQETLWSDEEFRIYGFEPGAQSPDYAVMLKECIHPDDRGLLDTSFRACLQNGSIFELEHRIVRPDGSVRFLYDLAHPHLDAAGKIVRYVGTTLDITERKQAEEQKFQLEAQLQQAQKMESVGRLAGGVAHDFNNMLGIILGYADMALRQVDAAQPLHADLEEICNAGERAADLTRQLLAFARKEVIEPRELDLNGAVGGMHKMLGRLIGENICLVWNPGEDLWMVKMDPSQIDQILANLCVNARDAIANVGTITIGAKNCTFDETHCADHVEFGPGEYVLLTVSDDGCGMDKETQTRIFEPFFTTKELGKGTGLGLATVYGAVRQNNGFINVHSEPGHGTTFEIYLPRCVDVAKQARTDGTKEPLKRGPETILLVEDVPALLKVIARLLEKQGYTVLAATTPGEAINLAREHARDIHLLMTDVVMPEMNGYELAEAVLSLDPQIKRLFMSGYAADIITQPDVMDEGVHFIRKPFSVEDLADKVRKVLDEE